MDELHEREQYFFDEPTQRHLAQFARGFSHPCCLCAPLVGQMLAQQNVTATVLDYDDRFSPVPGFQCYDLQRPQALQQNFGLIICDPPFFNVSLTQLFDVIRLLSHFNYQQPILLCYLRRRTSSVLRAFNRFNLAPTGYFPRYQTVSSIERNEIEFFGNLDEQSLQKLRTMNWS